LALLSGGIVDPASKAHNEGAITLELTISGSALKEVCRSSEWSILIVEAPIVQKFLRTVLEREGYQPVEAGPQSALDLMRLPRPGVGMVITNAPGIFLAFAEWVPLLYIAGCPDFDMAARFRTCQVLQKPFHPMDLLEAVKCLRGLP
jgi:hypothetical protein